MANVLLIYCTVDKVDTTNSLWIVGLS